MPTILRSLTVFLLLAIILCGFYPLAVTILGQSLFSDKANGQVLFRDGKKIGSRLIGQNFTSPVYFHSRPSHAGLGYDAQNSSGRNLSLTDPHLKEEMMSYAQTLQQQNPDLRFGQFPVDLITTSASGLDPDITVAAAQAQALRISEARHIPMNAVLELIAKQTQYKSLGLFGNERVNVLLLNLTLDDMQATLAKP